ncbi:hypothetical protein DSECCO2_450780 [anaerobic digester metagenome]
METKGVIEVCTPREDIIEGVVSDEVYAAHLGQVRDERAPIVYADPNTFFRNTYPTDGLKTTIREVFSRLSGSGKSGSPLIKLETSLGGGKTHTLIALYHLSKHGSRCPGADRFIGDMDFDPVNVSVTIGTEMGVKQADSGPKTIWGHIAKNLFGDSGYQKVLEEDREMFAPDEIALRNLFGDERCLILIDELALYLAKAVTVDVKGSNLAKQTIVFLQTLTEVAASCRNVVVVLTSLSKDSVFKEESEEILRYLDSDIKKERAKDAIGDAEKIVSRMVMTLTPTKGEEFSAVVRHRLFESVDMDEAETVIKAYMADLSSEGNIDYLPQHARGKKYLEDLRSAYPFHPELINILRTKTSSVVNFNKTRGVLRLLSKVVRNTWNEKRNVLLIHPYEIDFRKQDFVEEVVSRLDKGEYQSALAADISNQREPPRSARVDEQFHEPLGTMISNVVFLNSITGAVGTDIEHGVKEVEIYLSMARPGFDLKKAKDALGLLEDNCVYMVRQGSKFAYLTEPNLVKLIEDSKDTVERTRAREEVRDRIKNLYSGKRYFQPIFFPNEPVKVSDDTERTKLCVMDFDDCSIKGKSQKVPSNVRSIYEQAGSQKVPRIFANNLLFLVADEEQKALMEAKSIEYLALSQLVKDIEEGHSYLTSMSSQQKDRLKKAKQEAELYIKVAIVVCYRHVVLPSVQSSLEAQGGRPMRILSMRVSDTEAKNNLANNMGQDQVLVDFLRDNKVAMTSDDNVSPEYILSQLWERRRESMTTDDFRRMFFKNPVCGLILTEDLIRKSMKEGVKDGDWVVIVGKEIYDKRNHSSFTAPFDSTSTIILMGTETYREQTTEFYCATCGARRPCKEHEGEGGISLPDQPMEPKCPKCGRKVKECVCHSQRTIRFERFSIDRIWKDLELKIIDGDIQKFEWIRIRATNRNSLIKLTNALPQFGKVDMDFHVNFVINQRPSGGNLLELRYEGNRDGFNSLRQIVTNYEAKADFSAHDLSMMIKFADGIGSEALVKLLKDKIAMFTGEELYSLEAEPMERA